MTRNAPLRRLLAGEVAASDAVPGRREEVAWLGEALALEELTAAVFRRQHASNLLVIGQQEEAARALLATAVLALAAGTDATFHLIDGYHADVGTPESYRRVCADFERMEAAS